MLCINENLENDFVVRSFIFHVPRGLITLAMAEVSKSEVMIGNTILLAFW